MALSIGTNSATLRAAVAASSINCDMETSMARLSTGMSINSALDDAAGVAIASRLSAEIRGTDRAIRNALDGQALIDTAKGGHKEIEAILQRMREVSVQAANDTNNAQDRGNLQSEIDALTTEISRIAGVTTWAGNSVMAGNETAASTKTFSLQVGATTGSKNQIAVAVNSTDSDTLNLTATHTMATNVAATTSSAKTDASNEVTASADNAATTVTIEGVAFLVAATSGTAAQINMKLKDAINASSEMQACGIRATMKASDAAVILAFAESSALPMDDQSHAKVAIGLIDTAIKTVNTQRSELGAVSNRLSHTVSNLTNISTNLSAAKGGIEDADFALETTNLAKT